MAVVKNNKLFGSNVVIVDEQKEQEEIPVEVVEFIKEQETVINYNLVVQSETFEEFYNKQQEENVKKQEEEQPKKKGRKAKK